MENNLKRGDIYYADLNPVKGSEQGGIRPVLVVQNNVGNNYSPTLIVAPISTKKDCKLPTHILINRQILKRNSIIMLEQLRTIDKLRLKKFICCLDDGTLKYVDKALIKSLGIKKRSVL